MANCAPNSGHEPMGLRFGLENLNPKQKFRWLFKIDFISASDPGGSVDSLPPKRSSRPSLSFKEQECQHLMETIHLPMKPEWKPIQLHLYDVKCKPNPVFDWIRKNISRTNFGLYDPEVGLWQPIVPAQIKRQGRLVMLDGCGQTLEEWVFENCYPQNIEFGELDMDDSNIVTIDITLRYDRAYIATGGIGINKPFPPPTGITIPGGNGNPFSGGLGFGGPVRP